MNTSCAWYLGAIRVATFFLLAFSLVSASRAAPGPRPRLGRSDKNGDAAQAVPFASVPDTPPIEAASSRATASYGAGSIFATGASSFEWTNTSSSYQVVLQCKLAVPWDGQVYIAADASAYRKDGDYEAALRLGMDDPNGDPALDRWVNVYADSGDGTDRSVALSILKPVTAGVHTFYLVAGRYGGTGTVSLTRPTLTAVFIPSVNTQVVAAGASGNSNWTTTISSYQIVCQCTLTAPSAGQVFIAADTSLAYQDGDYEASLRLGMDNPNGDPAMDRWVNVYSDTGDGTDKSTALSMLYPVSAGTHTFYLVAGRYGGPGTVRLLDPSLTAIFTPTDNVEVVAAGASGNANWTNTSSAFQIVRECTLTAPRDGQVFLAANASCARSDGEYEVRLRFGMDNVNGDSGVERWVNVYGDSGDGTDENGQLSILRPVSAGMHTFYLLASRYSGAGTVMLNDPSLTAIFMDGPAVPPIIADAGMNAGFFALAITNLTVGTTNDIVGSTSLLTNEWTTSVTFQATSAMTNWAPPASFSQQFYRVLSRY